MLNKIREEIEKNLKAYIHDLDNSLSLKKTTLLLSSNIRRFLANKGKRVRPVIFVLSYLGFSRKPAPKFYTSAASLEIMHNFMLIHDDIIDNSDLRRNRPSMHKMLDRYLAKYKNAKFSGKELAIAVGDILYAASINAFLAIEENPLRKEAALKKLTEAAVFTGLGESVELISTLKGIEKITKEEIFKIYDLKTAHYTFCLPLTLGAILAGAGQSERDKLQQYGLNLGRAYQIKDDILDLLGQKTAKLGSPLPGDLQETKNTFLLWLAYKRSGRQKSYIKKVLAKKNPAPAELTKLHKIILRTKAIECARREISSLVHKANEIHASLTGMRPRYKELLGSYSARLLKI